MTVNHYASQDHMHYIHTLHVCIVYIYNMIVHIHMYIAQLWELHCAPVPLSTSTFFKRRGIESFDETFLAKKKVLLSSASFATSMLTNRIGKTQRRTVGLALSVVVSGCAMDQKRDTPAA